MANPARLHPRRALSLGLGLTALALSGCFYVATATPERSLPPSSTALPLPLATLDSVVYLPQTIVGPPAASTPTAIADAHPLITANDYQSEDFGIVWLRPDERWTFYDATGLEGTFGQLIPLVTLALNDEASPRFVTLLRADLPSPIVRSFAQMVETNPDLALQSVAEGMGKLGASAQLTIGQLAGAPAVHVVLESELSGTNFIWIVGRPQAVFYVLAEGFGTVDEVMPVLQGLHFTAQTPYEQALADGRPPTPVENRAQLVTIVEDLRGLSTLAPVSFQFMGRDDLRAMLRAKTTEATNRDETAAMNALLKLLGLLPPDANLLTILLDFYGAEIAGYYNPQTDTFLLIDHGQEANAPLSLRDQVIFVHEYTHALHDQYFDLRQAAANDDERAAFLALVEGDAQMVTSLYVINYIGLGRADELVAEASSQVDQKVLERTPPFIRDSAILFPYVHGQAFVQSIFLQGGWEAINAIWENPPISTEQILHPEKYPDDRPIVVNLPTSLPNALGGWREALRNVWGEYSLRLWLSEALGDGAVSAAAGWDGDQYLYLTNGERHLFVLHLVWDTSEDAAEGAAALRQWLAWRGLAPTTPNRYTDGAHNAYVNVQFSRLSFAFADDARTLNVALAALGWP